jgi:predicted ATPase
MSDGTLRVLGILLAVYQVTKPQLLAIEEPEVNIHPAAIDVLVDILKIAARRTQVIITTHSPDILDNPNVEDTDLYVIESIKGNSVVASLATGTRKIIKDKLYLPGELLRNNELRADIQAAQQESRQLKLFGVTQK